MLKEYGLNELDDDYLYHLTNIINKNSITLN